MRSSSEIKFFFKAIASKYDFINSLLSLGNHHYWNFSLIREIEKFTYTKHDIKNLHLVDLCAGTGAITFKYLRKYPHATATLVDFCPEMLAIAKNRGEKFFPRYTLMEQDVSSLPFSDESIPLASMAYGLRNLKDVRKCLKEVFRTLVPGGFFYILELTKPEKNFIVRKAHKLFLKTYVPFIGSIFTENPSAYDHLKESIEGLPEIEKISQMLEGEGFCIKKTKSLTLGSATIWVAQKNS
ncbi:ubiquinone/menaquinone biosynthesis methyltransferase [Chlamydiifrater volucris]|uniref:ubiquinone/menaquinone biosynthesis methyltransferase n=1 Tax=Chlamydiifrater volucris TaxID=2681470 RepID=UPI001BCFFB32|nr:ubiquinone/menaquinone biosynthesis methyltransferase [Chlamydiifrater volucris]